MKDKNNDLPEYLEEFLQSTRSSFDKILAAWDGLSVETQIKLLTKLEEKKYSELAAKDAEEAAFIRDIARMIDILNADAIIVEER